MLVAPAVAGAFDVESGSQGNQIGLRVFRGSEASGQGMLTVELAEAPAWVTSFGPRDHTVSPASQPGALETVRFQFDIAPGTPVGTTGDLRFVIRAGDGGQGIAVQEKVMPLTVTTVASSRQEILTQECCAVLMTGTSYVPTLQWIMFSVPLVPVPPDTTFPLTVLVDDLGPAQLWSLKRWNPATGVIVGAVNFKWGRGYFLRDNAGTPPESTLVDVDGAALDVTHSFTVAGLDSGFQELGNPYIQGPLAWDASISVTGPGSVTVPLDSAVTLGWIEPAIWKLAANGTWRFFFVDDGDGSISPWSGGLILPRVDNLELNYSGAPSTLGALAAAPYFWRVELRASVPAASLVDESNYFGFSQGASDTYDKRDVVGPFRLENNVELSFDNSGWGLYPGQYQQDVRPLVFGQVAWPVAVKVTGYATQTVNVTWPDLSQVPEQVSLKFINPSVPDTTDMRVTGSYTFTSGASGSSHAFKVLVDTSDLTDVPRAGTSVPTTYMLFQNQPNPFNPVTEIRFGVPADQGEVALKIYSVEGKLVRQLVQGRVSAGYHTVIWDGKSESGQGVKSGIYFCRLETPKGHETRKMTLLN